LEPKSAGGYNDQQCPAEAFFIVFMATMSC